MTDASITAALIQAGPSGLLVLLVLWLVRDLIPRQIALLDEQRKEFLAALAAERVSRDSEHREFRAALALLAEEMRGTRVEVVALRGEVDELIRR